MLKRTGQAGARCPLSFPVLQLLAIFPHRAERRRLFALKGTQVFTRGKNEAAAVLLLMGSGCNCNRKVEANGSG